MSSIDYSRDSGGSMMIRTDITGSVSEVEMPPRPSRDEGGIWRDVCLLGPAVVRRLLALSWALKLGPTTTSFCVQCLLLYQDWAKFIMILMILELFSTHQYLHATWSTFSDPLYTFSFYNAIGWPGPSLTKSWYQSQLCIKEIGDCKLAIDWRTCDWCALIVTPL